MICGKPRASSDVLDDCIELSEVSMEFDSKALREISSFLAHCADLLDRDAIPHSHLHIDEFVKGWTKRHPDSDIVVLFGVDESELRVD